MHGCCRSGPERTFSILPDIDYVPGGALGQDWRHDEELDMARALHGRHQRPVGESYEELLALDDTIKHPGLTPAMLLTQTMVQTLDAAAAAQQRECAVCLCEYEAGENVRRLPCMCCFHRVCVDRYFEDHTTCPVCRADVRASS